MAGGLAIGFAASRLLKASSRNRYESSSTVRDTSGNGATTDPAGAAGVTIGTPQPTWQGR